MTICKGNGPALGLSGKRSRNETKQSGLLAERIEDRANPVNANVGFGLKYLCPGSATFLCPLTPVRLEELAMCIRTRWRPIYYAPRVLRLLQIGFQTTLRLPHCGLALRR